MSARITTLGLAMLLSACGGGTEGGATTAEAGSASTTGGEVCEIFAARLCDELGRGTEGCAASAQVASWLPPEACAAALKRIDFSLAQIADQREDCREFSRRVCGEFGEDSPACTRVAADMQQIPPGACDKLLDRYPELIAQVRGMLDLSKPLSSEEQAVLLAGNPPSLGPVDAAVTIVEFSDFQCPYCSMAATTTHSIHEKYGDRVRIVFRQFPLSFHKDARLAAQASLAAHAQGKFWQLHDLMFDNQGALGRADLERYSQQIGLDQEAFKAALDDGALRASVETDLAMGEQMHVSGTPTMFINGMRMDNPTDFDTLVPTIDGLLSGGSAAPDDPK